MRYRLWRSGDIVDLSLEKKLGEGGEARVFAIAALGKAAKIYHHPNPKYVAKLKVMLANPPADPTAGQGHVSIAWPSDLLLHPDGGFHGYVMPLVEGMLPMVSFYVPKLRRIGRPLFDYFYLVTAALNVATTVRALHERNCVIGDLNESNILLADRALATVVDTDSFQVRDDAGGTIYRCTVGKPEFTPPELQGKDFALVDRTREHDCFGLGVLLFQLLMEGTHPFDGVYPRGVEPPSLDERIAAGHFPHAPGTRRLIQPKPIAPPFGMLDPALQRLFVQCFVEGHAHPTARPDAGTWRAALMQSSKMLRTCPVNDRHRHWGHVACPWCERTRLLGGMDPFPSVLAVRKQQHLQQRSAGAQTPIRAWRPIPARPVQPRFVPRPIHPRVAFAPRPPTSLWQKAGWKIGWALASVFSWVPRSIRRMNRAVVQVLAISAMIWVMLLLNHSHESPRTDTFNPANIKLNIPFANAPAVGRNFQAGAGINMLWIAPHASHARVNTGYWLAECEVTQAAWQFVMGDNPSRFRGENLPVERVSWNDAVEFCQKLTQRERAAGRLPADMEYRLPTEAQWEYASLAGYANNDVFGEPWAMAWHTGNSGGLTHDVETRTPNAWGLYDMCGNVWEWCADAELSTSDTGVYRMACGGSWADPASACTSTARKPFAPTLRADYVGFRVAAVSSAVAKPPVALTLDPTAVTALPVVPKAVHKAPDERVTLLKAGTEAGEEQGVEIADGVRVAMCWVPAGTFTMGSPAWEVGRLTNEEQTPVQLSQGFWLAKMPCDQQTWRTIMKSNPSNFNGGNLPVEHVSWNDCQAFIDTLRPLGGGWRFALPTEAQWEYACRAGSLGEFAGNVDAMAWHNTNSGETTHPVGTKQANAWGLQDMHGNVREWCRDAYASKLPGGIDPEVKNGGGRVTRGGSWFTPALDGRSAHRNFNSPDFTCNYLGFRLAAVPTVGAP